MQPTRFSGPILYSGRPDKGEVFSDQPLGFNPDFVQYFDDFLGTAIDSTNDYSVTAISNGTFSSYNREPASALPSSDVLSGWAHIQSANTQANDPTTVDSGAVVLRNEAVQPAQPRMPVFFEAVAGVNNPKNCDFFCGLSTVTSSSFNFGSTIRIGFQLDSSEGTGRLKAVAHFNVSNTQEVDTGFDMPVVSTKAGSFFLGTGNATPSYQLHLTAPILSMRLVNPFDRRSSAGSLTDPCVAYFYVNRQLVATIRNPEGGNSIATSIYTPTLAYEKKSELSGITLASSIGNDPSSDTSITFTGTSVDSYNGSGLYSGQYVRLDDTSNQEFVLINKQVGDWSSGGTVTFNVTRAQLGSSIASFSAGTEMDASVGAAFTDYMSCSYPRYPSVPSLDFAMVSPEIRR